MMLYLYTCQVLWIPIVLCICNVMCVVSILCYCRTSAGLCILLKSLSLSGNITPTVELNALAMKRGEPAVYTFMEPPHHHGNHSGTPHNPYLPPPGPPGHNYNYRGMYNQVKP